MQGEVRCRTSRENPRGITSKRAAIRKETGMKMWWWIRCVGSDWMWRKGGQGWKQPIKKGASRDAI